MDHGDGSGHFHHSCCRYIHRLPKVCKVGIYSGYHLYHDLVTVQEEVRIASFWLFALDGWLKRRIVERLHIKASYKLFTLKFNTFAMQPPLLSVCRMLIIIYICGVLWRNLKGRHI